MTRKFLTTYNIKQLQRWGGGGIGPLATMHSLQENSIINCTQPSVSTIVLWRGKGPLKLF